MGEWPVVNEWHAMNNGHVVSMSQWQVIIEWHAMSDGHVVMVSSLNPPTLLPVQKWCVSNKISIENEAILLRPVRASPTQKSTALKSPT